MTESILQSYCERCGTRYTFSEPTAPSPPAAEASKGPLGLFGRRGPEEAGRPPEPTRSSASLSGEQFAGTFHFCLDCRQYVCTACWNASAGGCLTCRPPGVVGTARPASASLGGVGRAVDAPTSRPPDDASGGPSRATTTPLAPDPSATSPASSPTAADQGPASESRQEVDEWGRPIRRDQQPPASKQQEPVQTIFGPKGGPVDPWRGVVFSADEIPTETDPTPAPPPVLSSRLAARTAQAWPDRDRRTDTPEPSDEAVAWPAADDEPQVTDSPSWLERLDAPEAENVPVGPEEGVRPPTEAAASPALAPEIAFEHVEDPGHVAKAAEGPEPGLIDAAPEPEYAAEPETETEPEPEYGAEPGIPVEPEPEYGAEPEIPVEPEPEYVAAPRPEYAAEPETEYVAEPEPEYAAEPETETEPELEYSAGPEIPVEPEPEYAAEPEIAVEPELKDAAAAEPGAQPEPEYAAEPEIAVEPETEITAEPAIELESMPGRGSPDAVQAEPSTPWAVPPVVAPPVAPPSTAPPPPSPIAPIPPEDLPPSIEVWRPAASPGPFNQPYQAPTTPRPTVTPIPPSTGVPPAMAPTGYPPSPTAVPPAPAVPPPTPPPVVPPLAATPPPVVPPPAAGFPAGAIPGAPFPPPPIQPPPSSPIPPPPASPARPMTPPRPGGSPYACGNCGLPLSAKARFCRRCGAPQS